MFDKECARGNAPCPSSPRAASSPCDRGGAPPVTEGGAGDKLKPSGSQHNLPPAFLNPLNHRHAYSLS